MITNRTFIPDANAAPMLIGLSQAIRGTFTPDSYCIHVVFRNAVRHASTRNEVPLRCSFPGMTGVLTASQSAITIPQSTTGRAAPTWPTRSSTRHRRQPLSASHVRKKNPTLIPLIDVTRPANIVSSTDKKDIPITIILTGVNALNVSQLRSVVEALLWS